MVTKSCEHRKGPDPSYCKGDMRVAYRVTVWDDGDEIKTLALCTACSAWLTDYSVWHGYDVFARRNKEVTYES